MLNRSVFSGRLTRDIEIQYTKNTKKPIAQFNLAVQRNFTNNEGKYDADFPRFLIWDAKAKNLASFTHKGSLIEVESHTVTSSYQRDGQTIYRTDNVVDYFHLLEPKSANKSGNNMGSQSNENKDYSNKPVDNNQENRTHSNANQKNSDPFADNSRPIDISDDDLPF